MPLGSRIVTGVVMDDAPGAEIDAAALTSIKPIREVLDAEAFVPAEVVALARWTAEYYAAGPGDTITAVLPPKARGGRADAHKTMRVASITVAGIEALASASSRRSSAMRSAARGAPAGVPTPSSPPAGRADAVSRLPAPASSASSGPRRFYPFEASPFAATMAEAIAG